MEQEISKQELSPSFMIHAYLGGWFPMMVPGEGAQEEPWVLRWFRPDPRAILRFQDFHVSRSLRRVIRKHDFDISWNQRFREVMEGCGDREETWLTPLLQEAYGRLFDLGLAGSVEVLRQGVLVGGVYGVSVAGVFFAESMFCRESNMSKVALWALIEGLKAQGLTFIDCQFLTPHLESLGAVEVSDVEFQNLLHQGLRPFSLPDP